MEWNQEVGQDQAGALDGEGLFGGGGGGGCGGDIQTQGDSQVSDPG